MEPKKPTPSPADEKAALADKWLSRVNEEPVTVVLKFLNFQRKPVNLLLFLISFTIICACVACSSGTVLSKLFLFMGAGSVSLHLLMQSHERTEKESNSTGASAGKKASPPSTEADQLRSACMTIAGLQLGAARAVSALWRQRSQHPAAYFLIVISGLYAASILLDLVPTFALVYLLVVGCSIFYSRVTVDELVRDVKSTVKSLLDKVRA